MERMHKGTFEYGWYHKGHSSWGREWHKNAVNVATEQIRSRIDQMVNIKELDAFTKTNSKRSLLTDLQGKAGLKGAGSITKISLGDDKSKEEKVKLIKENYFVVHVGNVRIKSGTDWSKTKRDPLTGKGKFEASATMLYDLEIWGSDGS